MIEAITALHTEVASFAFSVILTSFDYKVGSLIHFKGMNLDMQRFSSFTVRSRFPLRATHHKLQLKCSFPGLDSFKKAIYDYTRH
jgi:hypothetical protein